VGNFVGTIVTEVHPWGGGSEGREGRRDRVEEGIGNERKGRGKEEEGEGWELMAGGRGGGPAGRVSEMSIIHFPSSCAVSDGAPVSQGFHIFFLL
jgi:hypothetical protein